MKKNIIQQERFSPKLKVKKGDKVVVISGSSKDRTKIREVMEVFPEKQRVLIDQVNMVKKHTKATQENAGGIVDKPAPIHISNIMVIDPQTNTPTRVGRRLDSEGNMERYAKKSGQTIK
ncbi:MAG: 50S ribosomal protein L24 [Bacteroidetes bacterium]|nr:50S ribosomal protein L24 [Bacteroidota bacterium]